MKASGPEAKCLKLEVGKLGLKMILESKLDTRCLRLEIGTGYQFTTEHDNDLALWYLNTHQPLCQLQ
jgi:hypothetical protein